VETSPNGLEQKSQVHGIGVCRVCEAATPARVRLAAATEAIVQRLAAERVVVVKHLDAAGAAYLRLSTHCYNVREEIDCFVETYQRLSAATG